MQFNIKLSVLVLEMPAKNNCSCNWSASTLHFCSYHRKQAMTATGHVAFACGVGLKHPVAACTVPPPVFRDLSTEILVVILYVAGVHTVIFLPFF